LDQTISRQSKQVIKEIMSLSYYVGIWILWIGDSHFYIIRNKHNQMTCQRIKCYLLSEQDWKVSENLSNIRMTIFKYRVALKLLIWKLSWFIADKVLRKRRTKVSWFKNKTGRRNFTWCGWPLAASTETDVSSRDPSAV
jgi:hypothetical protein